MLDPHKLLSIKDTLLILVRLDQLLCNSIEIDRTEPGLPLPDKEALRLCSRFGLSRMKKQLADLHARLQLNRKLTHIAEFQSKTPCKTGMDTNSRCDDKSMTPPRRLADHVSGDILRESHPLQRHAEDEVLTERCIEK